MNYTKIVAKKVFGLICCLLLVNFFVSSCSAIVSSSDQSLEPSLSDEWKDNLILEYDNYIYTVTKETLTANDIDQKVKTVAYSGTMNQIGGVYYIFSIKNINDFSKIAIQTTSGFYIATRIDNSFSTIYE